MSIEAEQAAAPTEPANTEAPTTEPAVVADPTFPDAPTEAQADALRFLTQKDQRIQAARAELEEQRSRLGEQEAMALEYQNIKQMIQSSPQEAMERLGLQMDKLQDLTTTSQDPNQALYGQMQSTIASLQQRLDVRDGADEERFQETVRHETLAKIDSTLEASASQHPLLASIKDRGREIVLARLAKSRVDNPDASEAQTISEVERELAELAEPLAQAWMQLQKTQKSAKGQVKTLTDNLAASKETYSNPYEDPNLTEEEKLNLLTRATQIQR